MNIKNYLKSLFKRKLKTFLTISSISIGIISVLIIGSISNAGKFLLSNELDSLGVNGITVKSKNSSQLVLNNDHLKQIKSLNFVEKATPILMSSGYLNDKFDSTNVLLWGISQESEQVLSLNIIKGKNFSNLDINNSKNVCMLDISAAKSIFGSTDKGLNRKIDLTIGGSTNSYKIIGVVESASGLLQTAASEFIPSIIYLPYTTLQNDIESEELTQISVQVAANNEELDYYGNKILRTLNNTKTKNNAISIENLTKQKTKLMGTLDIVSNSLTIIGIISLFVSGLGTMTVMLFSVSERTKEIGIKKSIGAKGRDIVKEVIIETLLLSTLGAVIGIIFSIIIIFVAQNIFNVALTITLKQILTVILVSFIFGIVFGIYPAIHASRLNPVDALRREWVFSLNSFPKKLYIKLYKMNILYNLGEKKLLI